MWDWCRASAFSLNAALVRDPWHIYNPPPATCYTQGTAHRGMLLCCLAVATHRVLRYESGDDELVREVSGRAGGGVLGCGCENTLSPQPADRVPHPLLIT